MKNTLRALSLILILSLVTGMATFAGSDGIGVNIDGKSVPFTDAKPFIDSSSRTMIPVRVVAESLGSNVSWEEKTKTVTIERQDKKVQLVIGKKGITVNKVSQLMDTAAQISNNRTYVPLRFVGEAFDMNVSWDGAARNVVINTKPVPAEEQPGAASGAEFDSLDKRPVTATEAAQISSSIFTAKEIVEVKKAMFPVSLEYSTIEGVYKSTKDNMFIVKLSSEGYPDGRQYCTLGHAIRVYMKNGTSFDVAVMHLDNDALSLYPVLSKFGNVATEQRQIAIGSAEWVNPFFTTNIWLNNDMHDFKISDVLKIAIWDENTGHFESEGNVIVIPFSEIPEA